MCPPPPRRVREGRAGPSVLPDPTQACCSHFLLREFPTLAEEKGRNGRPQPELPLLTRITRSVLPRGPHPIISKQIPDMVSLYSEICQDVLPKKQRLHQHIMTMPLQPEKTFPHLLVLSDGWRASPSVSSGCTLNVVSSILWASRLPFCGFPFGSC